MLVVKTISQVIVFWKDGGKWDSSQEHILVEKEKPIQYTELLTTNIVIKTTQPTGVHNGSTV